MWLKKAARHDKNAVRHRGPLTSSSNSLSAIAKLAERYSRFITYRDAGFIVVRRSGFYDYIGSFSTSYCAPDELEYCLEIRRDHDCDLLSASSCIHYRLARVRSLPCIVVERGDQKEEKNFSSWDDALAGLAGISWGASVLVPSLLLPSFRHPGLRSATLSRQGQQMGNDVTRLTACVGRMSFEVGLQFDIDGNGIVYSIEEVNSESPFLMVWRSVEATT